MLAATQLSPEEALAVKLATPVLKTAPRVNGANGPTLAPDGNGGIAPAFVPVDFEPFVMCAPGWTGRDCKTRISDLPAGVIPYAGDPFVTCAPGWTGPDCRTRISDLPTGLPTGVDRAPPGSILPSEVTSGGAAPHYEMQNGMPVLVEEKKADVAKGFLIGPIAIAAAATIGLIALLRDRS